MDRWKLDASLVGMAAALVLSMVSAPAAAQPAGPLAAYRTNTVDPRVYRVPAEVQQRVLADPERHVEALTQALLAGVDDDFLKVKILHDWVAENVSYDVQSYLAGTPADTSWAATLRQRKSVCHGYASVLTRLCEAAAIPCATVTGYGRGVGFLRAPAGGTENVTESNHAWNAVQLGGRWRLVDVTWDAGHVEGNAFHKSYSTAYLFAEPRDFLYTHFPTEAKWQLLDPPLTAEQFADLPYLCGRFFAHGLRLKTSLRRPTAVSDSAQLEFDVPETIGLLAVLRSADGREPPRRTLVQRNASDCRVLITFPSAGRWNLHLHTKRRSDAGAHYLAALLEFQSSAGTASTFPATYSCYDDLNASLYRPLRVPLETGRPIPFEVAVRSVNEVHLVIGRQPWKKMSPHRFVPGVFELTAEVPPGAPVSLAVRDPRGSGYTTLVDFSLNP